MLYPSEEEDDNKSLFHLIFFIVLLNSVAVDVILFCRIISYMRHNAVRNLLNGPNAPLDPVLALLLRFA